MRYTQYVILALVLVLPFGFKAFGQETKQEAKPDASAPAVQEMKKDAGQDSPPAAAAGAKPEAKEATQEHSLGAEKRFVATIGADGVQHVEITGGEYYFDPNYIIVKVNTPVELTLKKAKGYPHDITVKAPEAGIDFKVELSDREAKTVKFTPSKVGKYEMMCDKKLLWFKSHKDRGMDGYIEVVP
jgi:plastocyanin